MGSEGGDTTQRPGMMPGVAATMAQSCGTNGTPHPMLAKVGSAGSGGRTLHSPQVGIGVGGKGTVQLLSGEATVML